MSQPQPDCNCREFLEIMGMSWYECMYGVICKTALDINEELMKEKSKSKKLEDHIDLLNKLKETKC